MPTPLTPPAIEDPAILARYPFLPQAKAALRAHLGDNGITVEGLVTEDWLDDVRARGRVRMMESIDHRKMEATSTIDLHTPHGQMVESLSFLYSMLTVCASYDERLLARWAEGESGRADQLFGERETGPAFEVLARTYLSDIRMGPQGAWEIPMLDFIELCPRISGPYWTLPNRPLRDGWVEMSPMANGRETSQQRLARLLKERIRESLIADCRERMERMDEVFAAHLAEEVGRMVALLQSRARDEISFTAAEVGDWPPCMTEIVEELNKSVNVNHAGRLFLASMSHVIGLSKEECAAFFANAPDYDAGQTTYQVGQIYAGEYTPAGCGKMRTNALCPVSRGTVNDGLCAREWMDHPLKYLRARQRGRARDAAAAAASDAGANPTPPAEESSND